MMGVAAPVADLSDEDYFALERDTDTRHEGVDGVACAMSGGTPAAVSVPR